MSQQDLDQRRQDAVAPAAYSVHPFYPARAHGSYVWDSEGKRYLDWSVGIAVMNVGHSHPKVLAAVKQQIDQFQHLCFAVGMHESYISLAEKLNSIAPGREKRKTFLVNSGAEAVENAIKIARVATGRQAIVAFTHAFHGRTHMALSLTAKAEPYKAGFAPRAAEVYRAYYPYCHRCPYGSQKNGMCCQADLAQLRDFVKTVIGEQDVAAFIIEPVAGEGGFIPAPQAFLQSLQSYAREIGALWIDDEIQAGIGRTGQWWAVDHYNLSPDIITSAKALTSGFPLSAVIAKAEVMDKLEAGQLGSTFGGNPAACAAALATLEVIEEEGLLERALSIGERLTARLGDLQQRYPEITDVRGLGAMIGLEFNKVLAEHPGQQEPHVSAVQTIVKYAREQGLILLPTGTYSNVIRLLPPLNMSNEELEEGLHILSEAIEHSLESAPVGI